MNIQTIEATEVLLQKVEEQKKTISVYAAIVARMRELAEEATKMAR